MPIKQYRNETAEDAFFCQSGYAASYYYGPACLSAEEFLSLGLEKLCPSGNCVHDCLEPGDMYDRVSQNTGTSTYDPPPPLYAICYTAANMTRKIRDGLIPEEQAAALRPSFPYTNDDDLGKVASTVTQCLTASCAQARPRNGCGMPCSAPSLLLNSTTPSLASQFDCMTALCANALALPYANQDIIGIGVITSYVIQTILVALLWTGLAVPTLIQLKRKSSSGWSSRLHEKLATTLADFHKAQCYFNVSLLIASLFDFNFPFLSDPVNAYILLPVALNTILSPTMTLLLIHRYGTKSWYPVALMVVTWILASVVIWGLEHYLRVSGPTGRGSGANIHEFEVNLPASVRHLSSINSCGGTSALNLCIWATGLSPLRNIYGLSYKRDQNYIPNAVAAIWTFCTLCVFGLFYDMTSNSVANIKGRRNESPPRSHHLSQTFNWHFFWHRGLAFRAIWSQMLQIMSSTPAFFLVSVVLFICVGFQASFFYGYSTLGLVETKSWKFGQIVAVAVWIPPVVEFVLLLSVGVIKGSKHRYPPNLTVSRVRGSSALEIRVDTKDDSSRADGRYQPLDDLGDRSQTHLRRMSSSGRSNTHAETIGHQARDDNDDHLNAGGRFDDDHSFPSRDNTESPFKPQLEVRYTL